MEENVDREQATVIPQADASVEKTSYEVHTLTDLKLRAVELLVAGMRPGVVAKRLEVSRESLWRWRQEPAFRRHVQRLRAELHASRIDRTWALVDRSLDVVEEHLEEGSLQAATTVLRLAQLNPTDPLPDGPEEDELVPSSE
jgi:hypothetical protein